MNTRYISTSDNIWRAAICYAVAFVSLFLDWWLMRGGLAIIYPNTFGSILKAFGDVALILTPYWWLKPNWRWTLLIPIWVVPIWMVCNLAYFRFWNDLIPPAAITMGGNVDSNLMEYGASLLRQGDLWMAVSATAATLAIIWLQPGKSAPSSGRMKLWLTAGSLLVSAVGQMSYFRTAYSWRCIISRRSVKEGLKEQFVGGYTGQRQLYVSNGMDYYLLRFAIDAVGILTDKKMLTVEERREIRNFIGHYAGMGRMQTSVPLASNELKQDTVHPEPSNNANVVYIIVESLNADMVGRRIEGRPVMPVLDSLSRMEGTVVMDNVVSQIKAASSSDGHLLLMTGLLPPDKTAYSITYGSSNRFPSIADALPDHNKYLLLADEGVCWNEGNTLRNFGLGEPMAIKDRPQWNPDEYGRDGAMLLQAAEMMKNGSVREPFLMTLMTISMHIPFKEKAWPLPEDLVNISGLTQMERDYANMCRNTDRYIGEFLKTLPDNTIVVIASDHHQTMASECGEEPRAYFMALNTGRTERVSRTIGQVNLFPATLEILGVITDGYRGLAPSAFNPCVDGTVDSYGNRYGSPSDETLDSLSTAYRISDLIIRGDYFKGVAPQAKGR